MQCSNCGNDLRPDTKFCPKCGALSAQATAHAPTAPPVPSPAPAGSFGDGPRPQFGGSPMGGPPKKSGCGKVLMILAGVGVLGLVALSIAGYYGYQYAKVKLKASEAYTVAIAALKGSPTVAEKMGEIKETGFPLGSFDENANGSGAAAYKVSVTGTKASGVYDVVMRRQHNRWALVTGRVTLADDEVINVEPAAADARTDNTAVDDNPVAPPPPPLPPGLVGGRIVSGGVLNGKAISLPEPAYPPVAKAVHAGGLVPVQVVVDETGKVISAEAVSGHPLLRQAAATAAKQARFTPTMVSGHPVKVTGTITYNFVAQ